MKYKRGLSDCITCRKLQTEKCPNAGLCYSSYFKPCWVPESVKKKKYHIGKTMPNKIFAVILILISLVPIWVEGDGTIFVICLMLCVPMFFAKENWIC